MQTQAAGQAEIAKDQDAKLALLQVGLPWDCCCWKQHCADACVLCFLQLAAERHRQIRPAGDEPGLSWQSMILTARTGQRQS